MASSAVLHRIAAHSEMVAPALLLVSDAGSFITGQTIIADGGMVTRSMAKSPPRAQLL